MNEESSMQDNRNSPSLREGREERAGRAWEMTAVKPTLPKNQLQNRPPRKLAAPLPTLPKGG